MNSHVKRKDGKPNRGGGRFNRGARGGSGGRGGGSSRGKGRGSSKGKGGGGGGGGGSSHEGRKSGGSAVMLGSLGDAVLSAKEEREDYIARSVKCISLMLRKLVLLDHRLLLDLTELKNMA